MKFSSLLFAATLAVAAVAAPLADLEREHFGRTLERHEFSPEILKRMPKTKTVKPSRDKDKIQRIKSGRWKGDEIPDLNYKRRLSEAPQYTLGWNPIRDSTPPRGTTGVVIREQGPGRPVRADHYYAEDTQPYTADLWHKTTQVYPEYKDHGFVRHGGPDQRVYTLATPKIRTKHGFDREEEPPQSYYYPEGGHLVADVPRPESKYQSAMFTKVNGPYPDAQNYFHDNRNDKSKQAYVIRGPNGADSNGAYDHDPRYATPRPAQSVMQQFAYPGQQPQRSNPNAQYITVAPKYSSSSHGHHYYPRRDVDTEEHTAFEGRDIFGTIEAQQSNASDTSRTAKMQQIEGFIWALDHARDNATALLQPFLEDLLNGTNSYLGESMAWGLYQMVSPDVMYFGPFMYGTSAFGRRSDNTTSNSTGGRNATNDQVWYEWGDAINSFYADLWANATAAVNATGLLADIDKLNNYLQPEDLSLLPEHFTQRQDHSLDGFYGFLASMYEYNGYIFTTNDTTDGYADFFVYDDEFADNGTVSAVNSTGNATQPAKRSPSWVQLW